MGSEADTQIQQLHKKAKALLKEKDSDGDDARLRMALAFVDRLDELSVTEICFAVGCSALGTFSTRFTELVGVPPSVYRQQARTTVGIPPCVAKQVTRPVRNREAGLAGRS